MNEENKSSISYDEGRKSVSDAEYPQFISENDSEADEIINPDDEKTNVAKKKKDNPKQLLITVQLVLCILAVLAAFALKGIGGEIYEAARDWYYTNLNSSAIFDENKNFDFNSIFGAATKDEAENT